MTGPQAMQDRQGPHIHSEQYGPARPDESAVDVGYPPASIAEGDRFFERTVGDSTTRWGGVELVRATYTVRIVDHLERSDDGWLIVFQDRLPAQAESYLRTAWSADPSVDRTPPLGRSALRGRYTAGLTTTQWELSRETPPEISDIDEYTFRVLDGEHSRTVASQFLTGHQDRQVDHSEGGVHNHYQIFAVEARGYLYSVGVVGPGPGAGCEGWYLTRMAHHPHRHPNTSTWFLSRIVGWLRQADTDRERLVALAGIDGNYGYSYDLAGFDLEGVEETVRSNLRREDRSAATAQTWTKRRWVRAI